MPKSSTNRERGTRRRRKAGRGTVTALALALVAAAAATRLPMFRPYTAPALPAPQSQPNLQLSKEYVYAGGRLVATEEPDAPAPPPTGPPTALVATAALPTSATVAVSLTWSAPASGSVAGYVVERAEARDASGQLQYAAAGPPVTALPTPASPYVDRTAAAGKVYLYRVKAIFASGGSSAYSNQDLAATVRYTGDDPLIGRDDPKGRAASPVRALILTELRGVVDSVRALAGLPAAPWRDEPPDNPRPRPGALIRAWHFRELRSNLNPALSTFVIAEVPDDPSLAVGQPIMARHIQDVRDRLR